MDSLERDAFIPSEGESLNSLESGATELRRDENPRDSIRENETSIDSEAKYERNQVIVKFKSNADATERDDILNVLGAEVVETTQNLGIQLWQIEGDVEDAIANFNDHPAIEYIEPNYTEATLLATPDDPEFPELWGLHNTGQTGGTPDADIDAPEAWDLVSPPYTGGNTVVGVLDTGLDYNHPDLDDNVWSNPGEVAGNGIDDDGNGYVDDVRGWDFYSNDNDPMDGHGHGTHVSGTIGAEGDNGTGVAGVNWDVEIMPLKIFSDSGAYAGDFAVIQAIDYAITKGANLTNNSWGGGSFSLAIKDAIDTAGANGQSFIAAAGNYSSDNDAVPFYPASYDSDNIISVAATDHNDDLASFSHYGATSVDLAAPGVNIFSSVPGDGYASYSGTSMAAPHVSGVASLLWSQDPSLSSDEVKEIILDTVDEIPALDGLMVTGGRLNANNGVSPDEPGSISGMKWNDLDTDGDKDDDEPGLEDWTIYIDENNNGQLDPEEPSTVTDGDGNYTFDNLEPGTYEVAEELQDGWQQTYPGSLKNIGFETGDLTGWEAEGNTSVETDAFGSDPTEGTYQALLTNGSGSQGDADLEAFLNLPGGTLDGLGNGDATEGSAIKQTLTVKAGDEISFDYNFLTNELFESTYNDFAFVSVESDGDTVANTFTPLVPSGTSFVNETEWGSYTHTFTSDGTYTIGVGVVDEGDSGIDSGVLLDNFSFTGTAPGSHTVDVGSGEDVEEIDFGNVESESGSISGIKWNDLNADGVKDEDEQALSDWTIYIDENNNSQLDPDEPSAVTDSDGEYTFEGLEAGTYTIREEQQEGWKQSYPTGSEGGTVVARDESDEIARSQVSGNLTSDSDRRTEIPGDAEYARNQVIVKFKSNANSSDRDDILNDLGAEVVETTQNLGVQLWQIEGDVENAVANFNEHPAIEYIEPNYIIKVDATIPDDPEFSELWGLGNTGQTGGTPDADIDAPEAWDVQTGNDVVVGVIDTGVDYTHPDLVNNMWTNPGETPGDGIDNDGNGYVDDVHGYDFAYGDGDPNDVDGHGTHVSGTIAGEGDNGVGVTGVSWDAQIMAVKFLNDSGSGTTFDAIQAVEYATMMGADLTNNSWGGGGYSQGLKDAIDAAGASGQLFMAAAGNSSSDNDASPHYPSSYDSDNIIAVAATDHNDDLAWFSSYGATTVDLAAPGEDILSSVPGGGYASYSGTSMATPHVAGVASLIWSQNPSLSSDQVKEIVLNTVDEIPGLDGTVATGGRLNAYNAVLEAGSIPHIVELENGENATDIDFGNWQPSSISGHKWHDLNEDGEWSDDEPPLTDWKIYIDGNENGELDEGETSAVTDEEGFYSFNDLTPDDYTIAEVQQQGWTQTAPEDGTHAIALEPGTDVSEVNFGNKAMPGSISGHKWNDLDEDGSKDGGEPGLEGWTIYLDENNNGQFDPEEPSTVTDGDGDYTFADVEPGTYEVAEVMQDGWRQTYPGSLKNIGFETGDLTGWETEGSTSVETDAFGSDPTEGTYQALITNGSGSQSDADLETFLNLAAGTLDGLGNGDATEGSAIKQTLTVKAGDEISFDYNFLTNELFESTYNDFAFVSVESDGDTVANTFTPLVPSGTSFVNETEWGSYTHTFTADGTYTVGVGAVDVGDSAVDSGVLLDNFSFTGTAPGSHPVDVAPGEEILDIDFGNIFDGGGSVIFEEDFGDNSAGWTLDDEWEIGAATASSGERYGNPDPDTDHSPTDDNGVAGVAIGGNAGQTVHDPYYLTSPVVDADVSENVFLEFQRYLNSDYEPYMANSVEVFDGDSWEVLWETGAEPGVTDSEWTEQVFDVTDYKNPNFRVRFGFEVGDDRVYPVSSWNLDDVKIYTEEVGELPETAMGETGAISDLTHEVQTISLSQEYENPVVLAQPASRNGAQTVAVRIGDVTADSFDIFLQEPDGYDGTHVPESVSYIVLEAGEWELADGTRLEVGRFDSDAEVPDGVPVSFDTSFDETPVVFSQVQTDNDPEFVRTRHLEDGAGGFTVALEEQEAPLTPGHGEETIGWFAIEPGVGAWSGQTYEAGDTGDAVTHEWFEQTFGAGFAEAPKFLASLATYDGPNPAGLRYDDLTGTGVAVMVEEDVTADPEIGHTSEAVNFLAIEGDGLLSATPASTSPATITPVEEAIRDRAPIAPVAASDELISQFEMMPGELAGFALPATDEVNLF